mmetsp:Transcript_20021/g.46609  ORF Transcript_20021/g.46609 Transcript_20021/m.46609 type:complete len:288 (-) Transcript_20021:917-1780(-)
MSHSHFLLRCTGKFTVPAHSRTMTSFSSKPRVNSQLFERTTLLAPMREPIISFRMSRLSSLCDSFIFVFSTILVTFSMLKRLPYFSCRRFCSFSASRLTWSSSFPLERHLRRTPLSAMYATKISIGKKHRVSAASHISTTSLVLNCKMKTSQRYANTDKKAVHAKTSVASTFRTSGAGIAEMQTALITRRLNAAEPTIVNGPSSGAKNLLPINSMMESMISGADEPSAMSVRLATVEFQTFFRILCLTPPCTQTQTFLSAAVISSIAPMNWSHTIAMPMKHQAMPTR